MDIHIAKVESDGTQTIQWSPDKNILEAKVDILNDNGITQTFGNYDPPHFAYRGYEGKAEELIKDLKDKGFDVNSRDFNFELDRLMRQQFEQQAI